MEVSCGVTTPFSWVLVHTGFCLCLPRASVSPVLWKFCSQIPLIFKVRFPGASQSLCQISRLRRLLWGLELSQQCENCFGVMVLQLVSLSPDGSIVGLMATSCTVTYNFFAEYIMRNARLDETQAEFKIARRNTVTSDTQMTPPLWQNAKKN